MASILVSLWKLSEKLGVTQKADTIEEQINLLNKSIGATQGNNIADSINSYADAKTSDDEPIEDTDDEPIEDTDDEPIEDTDDET